MAPNKQVKIVSDGVSYWLLWHWETLLKPLPNLNAMTQFVAGPFQDLESARNAIPADWTTIQFNK